jgi:NTE family protein
MADMDALLELAHRLPRPVAFVLGGGGSWGALQLGMLQALAHTDIRPDLVVGTSVGSLNGAILAADPDAAIGRLEALWPTVTRTAVFPGGVLRGLRTLSTSRAWIFDNEPLTDYLTATLPATTFEELALPFVAVATDFESGTIAELDAGDLRSALLASSAIPGVYPWVERDGRRLVDGALVANIPMLVAVRRGAKSLVVLDCGLQGVDAGRASTLVEVLAQSTAIFARRQIAADLEHCAHLPTVWLSRGRVNTTNQLDFSMTAQLITEGFDQSMATLLALGDVRALPAGLYGAPRELAHIPGIQPHVRHVQEFVSAVDASAAAPAPGAAPIPGALPDQ